MGVLPVIIHFNSIFLYKPSILGYPHDFGNLSYTLSYRLHPSFAVGVLAFAAAQARRYLGAQNTEAATHMRLMRRKTKNKHPT